MSTRRIHSGPQTHLTGARTLSANAKTHHIRLWQAMVHYLHCTKIRIRLRPQEVHGASDPMSGATSGYVYAILKLVGSIHHLHICTVARIVRGLKREHACYGGCTFACWKPDASGVRQVRDLISHQLQFRYHVIVVS